MDAKLDSGLLYTEEVEGKRAPATNPLYDGCTSRILKVKTARHHQHIGTLHEIRHADGSPTGHRHAADYTLPDCSRVRRRQPQER